MKQRTDFKEIAAKITVMKKGAEELKAMAGDFPALDRNTSRILASIKMLELNISDLVERSSPPDRLEKTIYLFRSSPGFPFFQFRIRAFLCLQSAIHNLKSKLSGQVPA